MSTVYLGNTAHGVLPAMVQTDGVTPATPDSVSAIVYKDGVLSASDTVLAVPISGYTGVYRWEFTPNAPTETSLYSLIFTITIGGQDFYYTREVYIARPLQQTEANAAIAAAGQQS